MKFCIEIDGAAVGGIGVHPGEDVHRHTATVGYWLGEEFWGRGIMTEAVTAVTDFCFENFPLRRISAEVFANNPASARVLEKAGFTFEGRLKNNVLKDGEASRFPALRPDKVASCEPATCVSVDHRRYGSPH